MLASRLGTFEGLRVADLFAGTGALGLEALSRGAAHCTFVETDRQAIEALRRNIARLGAGERADVRAQSALHGVPGPFDLVLMDPPYASGLPHLQAPHPPAVPCGGDCKRGHPGRAARANADHVFTIRTSDGVPLYPPRSAKERTICSSRRHYRWRLTPGDRMPTVIAHHDAKDTKHWLASRKREEVFGPLGVTNIRTFVDPQNPTQVALLMDVADMDAVMAYMQTEPAAEAMEYDGVLPETLVMLVEE